MDKSFQTSFIPKKPLTISGSDSENQPLSVLSFISIVIFVGTLVSVGGVYLYKIYLENQKNKAEESLISIRSSFEPNTIKELELFDKRTSVSKQLLASHTVMSPFFSALADSTLSAIQYTKFTIDSTEKGVTVNMNGVTRNYKYIALQSQIFNNSKNTNFKNVVFSNLVKDKNGNITFVISFDVNPSLLSYSNYVTSIDSVTNKKVPTSSLGADIKDTKELSPKTENTDPLIDNKLKP